MGKMVYSHVKFGARMTKNDFWGVHEVEDDTIVLSVFVFKLNVWVGRYIIWGAVSGF
jgi:hypothetical protein